MDNGSRECAEDLVFERRVKEYIEDRYKVKLLKMPQFCAVDFLVEKDGQIKGLIECRQRSCEFAKYPTLFFSQAKHEEIMGIAQGLNAQKIQLVVGYADKVVWCDLEQTDGWQEGVGNRGAVDYKRCTDNEPVWLIPTSQMRALQIGK